MPDIDPAIALEIQPVEPSDGPGSSPGPVQARRSGNG
jgi:hypothetical protein